MSDYSTIELPEEVSFETGLGDDDPGLALSLRGII